MVDWEWSSLGWYEWYHSFSIMTFQLLHRQDLDQNIALSWAHKGPTGNSFVPICPVSILSSRSCSQCQGISSQKQWEVRVVQNYMILLSANGPMPELSPNAPPSMLPSREIFVRAVKCTICHSTRGSCAWYHPAILKYLFRHNQVERTRVWHQKQASTTRLAVNYHFTTISSYQELNIWCNVS